ncbi:CidB/LrgB family autolysis modulator [Saccharibacillus sp. JS10]|uniref:CidB/LrgB family autolysis modulator n=1 Tax=Saccharibacillus sp. JS10 TaxID=2950552 RepID=UPI002108908B|nr:CidB/LrgB family autolysis modulator [Saccharibacillus sp. JS10]MCQ4088037.1 CidB/LrgB family autolysis modulator [Saccharibacillus sp. JS10]
MISEIVTYLTATLVIYYVAKWIYRRFPYVYLSPLLITPVILVVLLLVTHSSYDSYNTGGAWLSKLLQPATVAFAIPLYKNLQTLKKHVGEIVTSVLFGSLMAILSSVLLARLMHLNVELASSLAPRSVTTPIAMNVSQMVGGVPTITAVFVIMTGLLGAMIGPSMFKWLRIEGDIARGVLLGTSAHGTGTSKAFELNPLTGTISSISMILAALFTLVAAPMLLGFLG